MAVSGRKDKWTYSSILAQGSGEDYEVFCQLCDQDDIRLPAFGFCTDCQEHLCESCFIHHRKTRPTRHHTLLDKQKMPQTLQVQSKPFVLPGNLTIPCHKHKNEMIKYYCHVHKDLQCSVCVTLDHPPAFCSVSYIPDISEESLNSKEYTNTLKDLDIVTQECKRIIENLNRKVTSSNKSLTDVLADIKKFKQEINQRLDEIEKEAEDMVKALQQENNAKLKTATTTCHDVTESIKASSESIKQLNNSKQADRLFVGLKYAEKLINDQEEKLSELPSPGNIATFSFKPNEAITSSLQEKKYLGTVSKEVINLPIPPPRLPIRSPKFSIQEERVRTPKLLHHQDICVKTPQDQSICWITGLLHHKASILIVTDYINCSVKMVDLINNATTDQLKLDTKPYGITSANKDQVAVTLPCKETIQFISVSKNNLSLEQKIKVDGECYGISCYQEKLAVTFCSPGKLQIIDLEGKVITTVKTDPSGEDIFIQPFYVASNSHSVYVSDAKKQAVVRLNWKGEQAGGYGGMGFPEGFVVLDDGTILACDSDRGNIQHISDNLTKGNVVLEDLKDPQAICWCNTNRKICMSSTSNDKECDNYIKIFNVS